MSKKTMVLLLATVTGVMAVPPAVASGNWGVTPGNAQFSGSGSPASLAESSEPTIKCEGSTWQVSSYDGSGTRGGINLHFTKCSTTIIFRFPCSNTASPSSETITTKGTFHNVTITSGKRGVLVTPENTVIKCESVGNAITVSGNIIGEVTAPAGVCPVKTKTLSVNFGTTGSPATQVHKTIDGSPTGYDLTATTAGGSAVTAALSASATNTFTEPSEVTIDCNTP